MMAMILIMIIIVMMIIMMMDSTRRMYRMKLNEDCAKITDT